MSLLPLALRSWRNRKLSIGLSLTAIILSVVLFLGIEQVRTGVRKSFQGTISGTDLIIGPRGGSTEILLYSVFHIGQPKNNISFDTFRTFAKHRVVKWAIPISIGDSHKGYRVIGTNEDFYKHYRFRQKQQITFQAGLPPKGLFDVAIGADVARQLGYRLGAKIVLEHGLHEGGAYNHEELPFRVTGILGKTFTPIDRSVFVSLEAIEAIHEGWQSGIPAEEAIDANDLLKKKLKVEQISAFFLGLKSKVAVLQLQREVNTFQKEPLTSIMPALELQRLYAALSFTEDALKIISIFVVLVSLITMLIAIYSSLQQRRRAMAILRSIGARAGQIFTLFLLEALMLSFLGAFLGMGLVYVLLYVLQPVIENASGIYIYLSSPGLFEIAFFALLVLASLLVGIIPAWRAYRNTLVDGLTIRT